VVDDLAELNAVIDQADTAENARRITGKTTTVGQDFLTERPLLRPLPSDAFETGLWPTPRVDRFGRITVRCCHYSAPAGLIGRQVRVLLRASEVIVFDGRHPRAVSTYADVACSLGKAADALRRSTKAWKSGASISSWFISLSIHTTGGSPPDPQAR
jgi:hypothetical protein